LHLIHDIREGHPVLGITESQASARSGLPERTKRRSKDAPSFTSINQGIFHETNSESSINSQDFIPASALQLTNPIDHLRREKLIGTK
jgi:hypothetical protein